MASKHKTLLLRETECPRPACWNTEVSEEECQILSKKENVEPQRFPVQLLSGAPGSGNTWLLWLASLSSKFKSNTTVYPYHNISI